MKKIFLQRVITSNKANSRKDDKLTTSKESKLYK